MNGKNTPKLGLPWDMDCQSFAHIPSDSTGSIYKASNIKEDFNIVIIYKHPHKNMALIRADKAVLFVQNRRGLKRLLTEQKPVSRDFKSLLSSLMSILYSKACRLKINFRGLPYVYFRTPATALRRFAKAVQLGIGISKQMIIHT